jgi:hypothetical protein
MRIAHRRGVVEGVVVGAAIAGAPARRAPAAVVVPAAYPAYYGAPPPAVYVGAPPVATTAVVVNASDSAKMPPPAAAPYYPPAPMSTYPSAPAPAPFPAGYPSAPGPAAPPPPYAPAPSAPMVLPPAAIAAGQPPNPAMKAGVEAAAIARAVERRHFLIVNEANCSVLEVHRGNMKPGALVVSNKRRPEKPAHQIWYLDERGFIRNKGNEYAIEFKENGESVRLVPFTGDARQKWIFENNRIINEVFRNECLGLKKGLLRLKDDADVIACAYEGKPVQHWRMEYI